MSDIRAGRAFLELGFDDRIEGALQAARMRLAAFGDAAIGIGTKVAAIGSAIGASLVTAAGQYAKGGADMARASRAVGITADALGELRFAAQQTGAHADALDAGLFRLARLEGTDALDPLALSLAQLRTLPLDAQLATIADRLNTIEDPARRTAALVGIFGNATLLPLLGSGSGELARLRQLARDLGITIDDGAAQQAEAMSQAWDRTRAALQGIAGVIGSTLAPIVTKVADVITNVLVGTTRLIDANREAVAIVAAAGVAAIAIGAAIVTVGVVAGSLAAAASVAVGVVGIVGTAIGAAVSPIGLVTVAAIGAVGALLVARGDVERVVQSVASSGGRALRTVQEIVGLMANALEARDMVAVVAAGFAAIREATAEALRGPIFDILNGIDSIKRASAIIFGSIVAAVADGLANVLDWLIAWTGPLITATLKIAERLGLVDDADALIDAINTAPDNIRSAGLDVLRQVTDAAERERELRRLLIETTIDAAASGQEAAALAMLDMARDRREQVDASTAFVDRLERITRGIEAAGESTRDRFTAIGTFSAEQAEALAWRKRKERIAKATEQTSRNFLRLAQGA